MPDAYSREAVAGGRRKLRLPVLGYNRPRGEASRCYPATTCMDDERKDGGGDVLPAEPLGSWGGDLGASSQKCRWRSVVMAR